MTAISPLLLLSLLHSTSHISSLSNFPPPHLHPIHPHQHLHITTTSLIFPTSTFSGEDTTTISSPLPIHHYFHQIPPPSPNLPLLRPRPRPSRRPSGRQARLASRPSQRPHRSVLLLLLSFSFSFSLFFLFFSSSLFFSLSVFV